MERPPPDHRGGVAHGVIQLDSSIECVRCELLSNGRRRHLRSNGHTLYGSSKSDHFARDERCGGAVLMSGLAHLLILDRHMRYLRVASGHASPTASAIASMSRPTSSSAFAWSASVTKHTLRAVAHGGTGALPVTPAARVHLPALVGEDHLT